MKLPNNTIKVISIIRDILDKTIEGDTRLLGTCYYLVYSDITYVGKIVSETRFINGKICVDGVVYSTDHEQPYRKNDNSYIRGLLNDFEHGAEVISENRMGLILL
jgi:hypothetical protein